MIQSSQPDFIPSGESLAFDVEASSSPGSRPWFVYLFALVDCSAFKVGFSCSPLQRICTFSRRYFERFDLSQSLLLQVAECEVARAIEASLKAELAEFRAVCPEWIPTEAGGQTEWFSAVYFRQAEERLESLMAGRDAATLIKAADLLFAELNRMSASFELWACRQAQQVCDAWSAASRGYRTRDEGRSLRDWLDAYRYFNIPLFVDDPAALDFVTRSAALRIR